MIRYRLQCHKKHEFEAWFGSSSAYDRQAKKGQVECPVCGSKKVTKALMAPGVSTRDRASGPREMPATAAPANDASAVPVPAPSPEAAQHAEMRRQFQAFLRHVRSEVEKNAEYVGPRFADEARKIHHQEAQPRGIYGEATIDEAKELVEEGIDCLPLPRLPEDNN